MAKQVAEKLLLAVIPSGARNLLLSPAAENEADSSARQKAPGFGMTSSGSFPTTCKADALTTPLYYTTTLKMA